MTPNEKNVAEPSVERERAIKPVLKSKSNAPAALTQSLCRYTVMDILHLNLLPHPDRNLGSTFTQIEIQINQTPLLDLVAAAEEEPTRCEFEERVAAGEEPYGLRIEPGQYMYPTIGQLRRTGELSFGYAQRYFVIEPDDSDFNATVLLGCNCGEPGCWMLLIKSQTENNVITWSDFRQFHRPAWKYYLGPYIFDSSKYHQELKRVLTAA